MLAPEVRSIGRSICSIPASPGRAPPASASPGVSAPSIASAMCAATGSTSRRQTGMVCSIHSARLQAAAPALTCGKAVASASQSSASATASAIARCCPPSGLGSGPSEAAVRRAVSLATSQLTPEPAGVATAAEHPAGAAEHGERALQLGGERVHVATGEGGEERLERVRGRLVPAGGAGPTRAAESVGLGLPPFGLPALGLIVGRIRMSRSCAIACS